VCVLETYIVLKKIASSKKKGNVRTMETERGRTRSHSVDNPLWKRVWTCCKTGYVMTMSMMMIDRLQVVLGRIQKVALVYAMIISVFHKRS
jgi:hypothetical protein